MSELSVPDGHGEVQNGYDNKAAELDVPAAEGVDGEDGKEVAREGEQADVQGAQGRVKGRLAEAHSLGDGAVEERVAVEEDVQEEPGRGGTNERPPERLLFCACKKKGPGW